KVLTEATLLGFAASLMRFSYSFIDSFLSNHKSPQPPFSIPRLRFVYGAIAYSQKGVDKVPHVSASSHKAAYLLEELMDVETPFIKYIHNADAIPLPEEGEEGYETSIFLCFMQHVQFQFTHHTVYISDFQGTQDLIKDMDADIGGSLFGEGNVGTAFEAFTSQHICNRYCKWFQLEELKSEEGA
ncbi:hypothetical protein CPC08DRAFT_609881, partial [Agrocybe pediades]